jgi:DNA polymerase-3 subunit alpha
MAPFTNPTSDIPKYTHLKVHSSYSLGVGLNTPAAICAHAQRMGYDSVAITDLDGTYGFVEFHLAAKKHGIKPIYGTVIRHLPVGRGGEEHYALTLVALSPDGLRNIGSLASLSAAGLEGGGALDLDVIAPHTADVVAFAGGADSEIARMLLEGDDEIAPRVVGELRGLFEDRFFVEIQDHGMNDERVLADKLLALAANTRTAPLLTQGVRYMEKGMRDMYGTLRGIREPGGERDFFKIDRRLSDRSMKSLLEVSQLHPFYEAAYDNTRLVDEMIPGDLLSGVVEVGKEGELLGSGEVTHGDIRDLCTKVIRRQYENLSNTEILRYQELLDGELDRAFAAGAGPTLYLFHRLTASLRDANVDLGPATGLSVQSLCAYLLGITAYDPYRFDPRFEPSFSAASGDVGELELQLTGETRDEAIHTLFETFDFGSVAYLPAVERVTPARAVRMVAGVVELPEAELQEILRIIGRHPGVPLKKLNDQDWQLGRLYKRSLPVRDVLSRAALLENLPMGFIRSRRSMALSALPLTDFLGHSIDSDTGDLFVQAGRDCFPFESVYRVDITTLSALSVAVGSDRELRRQRIADYGWDRLPLSDDDVWGTVQGGDTTGVFLFEGPATLQQRENFPLRSMADLTNFLALMRAREDDLSLNERFTAFQAEEVEPNEDDALLGSVLRSTRGSVLFLEQVRDIIVTLTGETPADALQMIADMRAASPAGLSTSRKRFMMGTAEKNVPLDTANRWFERLLQLVRTTISHKRVFADALLVYKLFFLKTRHECEFFAALLNANLSNESKRRRYMGPLRERDLVLELDVNESEPEFTVEEGRVRVGLRSVAGMDRDLAGEIVKARGRGRFTSLEDFVRRVGPKNIEKEQVRKCIDAGGFESLGQERSELLKILPRLYESRRPAVEAHKRGQMELPFDA